MQQKIIVFKEKHGNRYFDASTDEKVQAVALKIFNERLKEGYWYMDIEQRHQKYFNQAKDGNAKSALIFLQGRSNSSYEYEMFSFEYLEDV